MRGDRISVEHGSLAIKAASGRPVPDYWLKANRESLLGEISRLIQRPIYIYDGYSTGLYGEHKSGGVCLHYLSADLLEPAYVIFNANLYSRRASQYRPAGMRLKNGKFTVTKRYEFVRFWRRCGHDLPLRLSAMHDCMGRLKHVCLFGETKANNRFDKQTLTPATVDYEELINALHELDIAPCEISEPEPAPKPEIEPTAQPPAASPATSAIRHPSDTRPVTTEERAAFLRGMETDDSYSKIVDLQRRRSRTIASRRRDPA